MSLLSPKYETADSKPSVAAPQNMAPKPQGQAQPMTRPVPPAPQGQPAMRRPMPTPQGQPMMRRPMAPMMQSGIQVGRPRVMTPEQHLQKIMADLAEAAKKPDPIPCEHLQKINDEPFSDVYITPDRKCYTWAAKSDAGLKVVDFTDYPEFLRQIEDAYDGKNRSYLLTYEGRHYRVERTIADGGPQFCARKMPVTVPPINTHYDVVLHAAGKAHVVPKKEEEKQAFYDVNYQGTINLCTALEHAGVPKVLVFISTVAVYGCEYGELIDEFHPLNGNTPYAESKKMAEDYLTKWCLDNQVKLSILRPSLLAGKNAPGNLGAMVNGIKKGFYLNIAGGKVRKSVLMAEDIARLLPILEEKSGIYNVCDTNQPTFGEISASVAKQLGKRKPISIPYWMAWCMAKVGDLLGSKAPINSYKLEKMTKSLTFSNEKARRELGWEPLDVLTNYQI